MCQDTIDLLNMDIQGAELKALRGARQTLPNVKCIHTEINRVEFYEGCGLVRDLDDLLKLFGFQRVETSCPYHRTWGDALYVKPPWVKTRRRWRFFSRRDRVRGMNG